MSRFLSRFFAVALMTLGGVALTAVTLEAQARALANSQVMSAAKSPRPQRPPPAQPHKKAQQHLQPLRQPQQPPSQAVRRVG